MPRNQKLNVGLVFDDSLDKNDGVAQYVKTLGSWLSGQEHDVSYLVGETKISSYSGGRVYSLAKNVPVKFNGNSLSMPLPASSSSIRGLLDSAKFDVLHIMMPYSPFMGQKIIKLAKPGTKIVATFHIFPAGRLAAIGGRLLRLVNGRSIGRIDQIASVSPAAQSYAKAAFGVGSRVIPNPVNTRRFGAAGTHYKKNHIVFLGRLVKRKGCRQLIEAFSLVLKDHPDARLSIAGDGPLRQKLQNRAKKLGIMPSVDFLGYISETAKPPLLASAHVACFPSLYGESFGIVLIEAMAAGAGVVIGGNNPGYASVLGPKPFLLVDPESAEALAAKISDILADDPLASSLHEWQDKEVRKYDIDVVGRQIIELYNS
jgi:phosphatidyl-myo-inositol alpha-mannosyltransferase